MKTDQQSLFDLNPPPWEVDDAGEELVATIVLAEGPTQPFDYAVPEAMRGRLSAGQRVRAPFGRGDRLVTGYCVRLENRPTASRRLKPLASLVDQQALLRPAMLRLAEWMVDYYLCSWGQALEAIVPAGVRFQAGTRQTQLVALANRSAPANGDRKLTAIQQRIVDALTAAGHPLAINQLARAARCTVGPIRTLEKRGIVTLTTARIDAGEETQASHHPSEAHLELNADQRRALDAILPPLNAGTYETILIHGVTGSGKTEVYIQAIQEVLRFGRQAIVLVPEISLTPQTEARFRSRFGRVALLHSHMTNVERRRHWERIAAGQIAVVVGARSAVFAPTPQLGLIVLDEEHETSFKQDIAPRYNARDVALERARAERIPLVLGSATPALESWHRAQAGQYRLVSMPSRVFDRPMPQVGTIDLRAEQRDRYSRGAISRQLTVAMEATLKDDGQIILLLNRRGFSTHIQCPACGAVVECPECAIALTHHVEKQIALCHYCDYQIPAPLNCPQCNFEGIRYGGFGTQRLEAEVKARFPQHVCLRMDTDTMQKPGSHAEALRRFRDGEVRILVGTQMIAKGLDFPNVMLVGVINADTALHLPDFRAAERTFQLVTQVAGRTGRGERGGRVLVQTFSPDHPAIMAAVRHDYAAFAATEMPTRESFGYPPYTSMVRLVIRGPKQLAASEFAEELARRVRAELEAADIACRVLGPAPAPISKLRGHHRFQIQLQSHDGPALRRAVRKVSENIEPPEDVLWIADVDPLDML